jgi:hypothetical protein
MSPTTPVKKTTPVVNINPSKIGVQKQQWTTNGQQFANSGTLPDEMRSSYHIKNQLIPTGFANEF